MTSAWRCPSCSAPTSAAALTCEHCGATLQATERDARLARFEGARRSAHFATVMALEPSGVGHLVAVAVAAAVVIAGGVAAGVLSARARADLKGVALAIMAGAGVGALLLLRHAVRFVRAPLERTLVQVRDERTEVERSREDKSTTTWHFALVEDVEGARREHRVDAATARALVPGDFAVTFTRAGVLLRVERVSA